MFAAFIRIVLGFALACLAAAITQVLFVITPADLYALDQDTRLQRIGFAWLVALSAATQAALFAAPFALLAIIFGGMQGLRGWAYYVFVGLGIALAGFVVLYAGENSGQPTIANGYAVAAFAFSGIIAGYVYWLIAGHRAGGTYKPQRSTSPEGHSDYDDQPEEDTSREHLKVANSSLMDEQPVGRVGVGQGSASMSAVPGVGKPH
ncbi:MAG: hypothetical protein RIC14_09410 [Filomicrobium sp.]